MTSSFGKAPLNRRGFLALTGGTVAALSASLAG